MNESFLEQYYEVVVLPLYAEVISFAGIKWKDHGKVGPDSWAHWFEDDTGREFALLYEDFPDGSYLSDELTHEIVTIGDESTVHVAAQPGKPVDNLLGYFTLYAEKPRNNP